MSAKKKTTAKKAAKKAVKKAAKRVPAKAAKKSAAKQAPARKLTSIAPAHTEVAVAAYLNWRHRLSSGLPGDECSDWFAAEHALAG